ncbi:unnamed protein product [Euphydryas editha]|uniref:RNA-directed DNA polymerase n=1 Tax=Euphydryas editha TaxID=104508 RepID=A0AAU9TFW1_EUPED|nr:unnamed protein product [Euphydryas editha]
MSNDNVGSDASGAGVDYFTNIRQPSASTSEVGCPPTSAGHPGPADGAGNVSSETVSNLTNATNMSMDFCMQMMQTMRQMSEQLINQQSNKVRVNEIFLPSFDPDGTIGVREWCQHVTTAIEKYKLDDYDIRMKVGSLLKGRAKLWVDSWLVSTNSWDELRDSLITTFEPENRYSRDVVKFREHFYDHTKDIAEFLSQSWVLWKRLTKDKLSNDDAVEAVIGCINNERLRIDLMNARAKSVPELISVASSIRLKKRNHYDSGLETTGKRLKLNDSQISLFCKKCKRNNHTTRDCKFRSFENDSTIDKNINQKTTVSPQNKSTCTFCMKIGHTYENCFKRDKSIVNINCVGNSKTTTMRVVIGDYSIQAIFDSGAECSVMCESVASKLPGKRIVGVKYLRGIGQFPVISLITLETVCEIDGISIEVSFCIVPDYELSSNVLIGMDLIKNTSLSVLVTNNGSKLFFHPVVNNIRLNSPLFEKLDCDLADIDEIRQLKLLLNKYAHLFISGFPTTRVNTGKLEIRLKNPDKYVERRPYRLSPIEREKVANIVKDLIDHNIIRESRSPYSSPIILVKKKNGDDRLCVDYRELNSNTLRDHYPLPLISDQIDQLVGGHYYNSFDMAAGFHQIPIAENSIEKTAFVTPDGLYEFLTMPFGLSNACAVYQRCINRALQPLLSSGVAQVYVDDVLSKCVDFSEGLANIERILIALQNAGFSINVEKSSFFKRSIEYLGNIISDGQVRPSPRKIDALVKSPIPNNVKQVRQFNGLAGYFRRFIPNFSRIMIPLYELTKKGAHWEWNERHENARNTIIEHLISAPVLTIFQEDAPTELYTDASSLGFGAILVQVIEGRRHAVAYMSMRTTEVESRYHSYELETLAVVRAIKHFKQYLYGRKFKVITDCNALKASKHKKELLPRVYRWWAFLQNYDFDIEYRKGEHIQHADFFSRNPGTFHVNIMTRDLNWLKVEQRRDSVLRPIIDALTRNEQVEGYLLEDNVLTKVWLDPESMTQRVVVVPKTFQWSLINTYHSALKHPGWEKTLQKIKETYWFDKMSSIIRTFVENCVVCKTSKSHSGAIQARLHPIPKPTAAFQAVHMDITGKLGTSDNHEYVIITIDSFSKYVLFYYATDKSPHSTLAALKRTVHLFGTPTQIIVDGGREFLGEFKLYCDNIGIAIHAISPGTSRANGQVERMVGTLKNGLVMINNYETQTWPDMLDGLQLAFNCTPQSTTGVAPLSLITRRQHCVPPELNNLVNFQEETINVEQLFRQVQRRMFTAAEREKLRFDRNKAKIRPFRKGDYVLIKNNPRNQTSLDLKFSDPYEVCSVLENDRYMVKKVVGRGRPRKVSHDQLRLAPQPGLQATVSAENNTNNTATNSSTEAGPSESNQLESQPSELAENNSTDPQPFATNHVVE